MTGQHEPKDLRIAYIGGGSRGWAWTFMTDLALNGALGGEIRLYDIDRAAAAANEQIGNRLLERPDCVGRWHYRTVSTLEQALVGADFVVISILPGTFAEMEADVHLPETLGIYQSVGDTAGPGGMIRALRTLPMFVPIAEAIRDYAPDAFVINYTNPMSLCIQVLYRVFPGIHAFGCCHEVFGTQKLLAAAMADILGVTGVTRQEIAVNVQGINHFTWFDEASCRGVDLFPVYEAFVEKYRESGFDEPDQNWMNSTFCCAHRVKFDLFCRYHRIAAAGDRHLAEFMPGDWYLKDPETVRRWKFGLTTVQWRKEDLNRRLARSRRLVSGEETMPLTPSGEEGILLIQALCGLGRMVSNVNLPNRGQIPNLPLGAVVETNAVFSKQSVKPVLTGDLSEELRALTLPHVENHARILEAALTCDRELVVQAFLRDPLVAPRELPESSVRALVDAMLEKTKAYLPTGWWA